MCGIFGYIGNKEAAPILTRGLKDLEYRGYDSAGMYITGRGSFKAVGPVKNLEAKLLSVDSSGLAGIAHTRWATHGKPTESNAHPHSGNKGIIWLVHNGVIENYKEIKKDLIRKGSVFKSDTDTEVIVHLIESFLPKFTTLEAIQKTVKYLEGSYALALVDTRDRESIYVVRKGSPLVVGVGKDEIFISSDSRTISRYTKNIINLDNGEIGVLKKDQHSFFDQKGKMVKRSFSEKIDNSEIVAKGEYKHFMLKEIMEQVGVIRRTLKAKTKNGRVKIKELEPIKKKLRSINKIIIVGCGTAYNSALVGKYFFEEYLKIDTAVEMASEFRYRKPVISKDTLVIALSQSGETADTLEAIREAKRSGAYTLGIINVPGSTMSYEVDTCLYNNAGPEIGVASTKAFTAQVLFLILVGCAISDIKTGKASQNIREIYAELLLLPKKVGQLLKQTDLFMRLAKKYSNSRDFIYLGRGYQYAIALEGALKLKEISYIHAEGYSSGEMKHGPLALIDKDFPSIVITPQDNFYEKNASTIQEIRARDGKVVAIATKGDKDICLRVDDVIYIPKSHRVLGPILSVIPLQLFAYHVADQKGLDVDKPRNLAKSVTVE